MQIGCLGQTVLTDAHCHPFDLNKAFPAAEADRRRFGVLAAASATTPEEFAYNEQLAVNAKNEGAAALFPCFALHPQLPAEYGINLKEGATLPKQVKQGLELLEQLAGQGRLAAIGETGFDLFDERYKVTEAIQEQMFAVHLEAALHHDLPLVLHVRRAMHKIFTYTDQLKKCRAVVFHSWSGTLLEGESLLKRGVNAFFSFGANVLNNHREAQRCSAAFPSERLLLETDAPWQPPHNAKRSYSTWEDLPAILQTIATLSGGVDQSELEKTIESNFKSIFGDLFASG